MFTHNITKGMPSPPPIANLKSLLWLQTTESVKEFRFHFDCSARYEEEVKLERGAGMVLAETHPAKIG